MQWEQPVNFHTIFEPETIISPCFSTMKKLFAFVITLLIVLNACHQTSKTQQEDSTLFNWENAQSFISDDSRFEFMMMADSAKEDGIVLLDKNSGTIYHLNHVAAASGVKYADEDGYTFWTKGNDFIWSNHMNMITSGKLKSSDFSGNYVTPDYFQRNEGYDWMSVCVKNLPDNQLYIKVRSRADKKKPTCTMDAMVYPDGENRYSTMIDGKKVLFTFLNDTLEIAPENPAGENVLYFYCSGGATIAGKYVFTSDELDPEQIDPTAFSKVLELQGIGFNVSSVRNDNGMTEVTITPFGLETDNRVQNQTVEGSVVDAEIEDLNADGSPELLIYTTSDGSGSYGNVLAFSVNNRKSMSMVYFSPISDNPTLSKGYMGHDEFRVVENRLVQRFPIYNEGDSNSNPTGGIRQISYKLVEGEAMRRFEVKDITKIDRTPGSN